MRLIFQYFVDGYLAYTDWFLKQETIANYSYVFVVHPSATVDTLNLFTRIYINAENTDKQEDNSVECQRPTC